MFDIRVVTSLKLWVRFGLTLLKASSSGFVSKIRVIASVRLRVWREVEGSDSVIVFKKEISKISCAVL